MMFRYMGTHLSVRPAKYSSTHSKYTTMDSISRSNGSKHPAIVPSMVACYVYSRLKTARHFSHGVPPLWPVVVSLLTIWGRGINHNVQEEMDTEQGTTIQSSSILHNMWSKHHCAYIQHVTELHHALHHGSNTGLYCPSLTIAIFCCITSSRSRN